MSELVRFDRVSKWAGEGESRVDILRGVSLRIQAGEFVAVMGPSGSGKSSLLNLMGLLDRPDAGSITLLGTEVSRLDEDQLAALRARSIGFIFQTFNLLAYLDARHNVELPMGYAQRADVSQRSQELLNQVNLLHRANAYPATLSGGERQRVAIARALANEPALLLADEPTGALDSQTGSQIIEHISHLHHAGMTVILVTHDASIARRAQRILSLKDGRLD